MSAEEKLLENGYEGVKYLQNYSYDDALIGVTDTTGLFTTTKKWSSGWWKQRK